MQQRNYDYQGLTYEKEPYKISKCNYNNQNQFNHFCLMAIHTTIIQSNAYIKSVVTRKLKAQKVNMCTRHI